MLRRNTHSRQAARISNVCGVQLDDHRVTTLGIRRPTLSLAAMPAASFQAIHGDTEPLLTGGAAASLAGWLPAA